MTGALRALARVVELGLPCIALLGCATRGTPLAIDASDGARADAGTDATGVTDTEGPYDAPPPDAPAGDDRAEFRPDPSRPWSGVVWVNVSSRPLDWRVDGALQPTTDPVRGLLALDTRALADGTHRIEADISLDGNSRTLATSFVVSNGVRAAPPAAGRFVEVTALAGIDLPPDTRPPRPDAFVPSGAVSADFDGDGDVDVYAWGRHASRLYFQTAPMRFSQGVDLGGPLAVAAGAGDLDGDGDPDLVVAGLGLAIYRNDAGTLVDVTARSGVDPASVTHGTGVTLADVDMDGLLDVAVAQMSCVGRSSFVLRNEGAMQFGDVAPALGLDAPTGATFTIGIDLLPGDDALHVWQFHEGCTPVETAFRRLVVSDDLPVPDAVARATRSSPMGSAYLDIDGDGALELFLAEDFGSRVWRLPGLRDDLAPFVGLAGYLSPRGAPASAWSVVLLDADLDGRPDLFVTHDPSPVFPDPAGAGDSLFWQRAPGLFRDAAVAMGLDAGRACRAAHGEDLDRDGDTDLLVGCADGPHIWRNDVADPSVARTVVLHGTVSNADGVHAVLTTPSGESRLSRGGGQPYAGGVLRESVRLAGGPLTVRWPSGIVQRVDAGIERVLHVTEPALVRVSPRRVPTGGGGAVTVEVDPRLTDDPGATVTVEASAGVWTSPLARSADGVWRGTLVPPVVRSVVVLRATVGRTALLVRPRVFVRP